MLIRPVLLAVLATGCMSEPETVQQIDTCEVKGTTWCAPIGAACDTAYSSFCDHGGAWCEAGVCRDFCSAVDWPRCAPGELDHHDTVDGSDVCTCIPG